MSDEYKGTRMRFIILASVLILLAGFGCRENTVNSDGGSRPEFLTAEDVGVTDVWLRIKLPFSRTQHPVTLKRDTTTIFRSVLTTQDTLIYDEHLLPNRRYTYILTSSTGRMFPLTSALTITTMDTTSHNFTWQIDTLGDGNSSVLYDVAIINDTCAWAVGEIYKKDSLGNWDYAPYGAARWDGKSWHLMKVPAHDYGSSNLYPSVLKTIWAFAPDDVYVCTSANLLHWDGSSWTEKAFFMTGIPFTGQVSKMWGTSGSNLYCVGRNGAIYHYDGTNWEKMESGTDVDLLDIWGTPDGSQVWACGTNFTGGKSILLIRQINGNWMKFWNTPIPPYPYVYGLSTLWTSGKTEFLLSGTGGWVYQHSLYDLSKIKIDYSVDLGNYPYRLRGSARNNVVVIGDGAMVWHCNGKSWKKYSELYNLNDRLYGLAVSDRMIITVGTRYGNYSGCAYIIIGNHS